MCRNVGCRINAQYAECLPSQYYDRDYIANILLEFLFLMDLDVSWVCSYSKFSSFMCHLYN